MNCSVCGGTIQFKEGMYICNNCGSKQTIHAFFEQVEVFVCYIENDEHGRRTKDSLLAQDLYNKLENAKIHTFYQRKSASDLTGNDSETANAIAFDCATVLVMVANTFENFYKLMQSYGEKSNSKTIIPVYSQMNANELPTGLKQLQAINYDTVGATADLIKTVLRILGKEQELDIRAISNKHMSRKKRTIIISLCTILILTLSISAYVIFSTPYVLKSKKYAYAENLKTQKSYLEAIDVYSSLGEYKNAKDVVNQIYDVYDGYYTKESEMLSLQLNIDKNYNTDISVIHIIDGNKFVINATAAINQNSIEFSFIDTQNNTGQSIIQLENDGLSLNVKMDDASQVAKNLNVKFNFSEKTDVPLLKEIDAETMHQWLLAPQCESDFINAGYDLSVYGNVHRSTALIKKFANSDIYAAIFHDLYLKEAGGLIEYQHIDDGAVLAFQGPASIICPEYIGAELLKPIITENIVYMPESIFLDMGGRLGLSDGNNMSELIAENKSTNGRINSNTIVSVTSKQLIGEENWNAIMVDMSQYTE